MNVTRLIGAACLVAVALVPSLSANAAFIITGGSSQPLPVIDNDFNSNLQALGYTQMTTGGQLSVDQDGFVTFFYIAAESAFTNTFNTSAGSMVEADDAFNFAGYDSITVSVAAGDILDFSFTSDGGANALTPVDNFSGTNLQGLGIFTGSSLQQVVLGYDDQNINPDDNHDDMLVRVDFSPVPVPAAVWLFGSGLLALIGVSKSRKK